MIKRQLAHYYRMVFAIAPRSDRRPLYKSLMVSPDSGLVFARVPKAGCSSVIGRLLAADKSDEYAEMLADGTSTRALHARNSLITYDEASFILRLKQLKNRETTLFAVVRNPFTRILSSYTEKIELQIDGPRYRKEFGIAPEADISFEDFIAKLTKRDPLTLDLHFMPQSLILRSDFMHYDKLFHLETTIDDAFGWLDTLLSVSHTGTQDRIAPHATMASERAKTVYSDELIAAVSTYYENDFSHFGYAPNLQSFAPRTAPQMPGVVSVQDLNLDIFTMVDIGVRSLFPVLLERH